MPYMQKGVIYMENKFRLDDDALLNINGGTYSETDELYEFIKRNDPQGYNRLLGELRGDLSAYFASIGIDARYIHTRYAQPNVYYDGYDGDAIAAGTAKTFTHAEVMDMLKNRLQ